VHGSTHEVSEDREPGVGRVDRLDGHDSSDISREPDRPVHVLDEDGAGPDGTASLLPALEIGYPSDRDASVEQRRVAAVIAPGRPADHVGVERGGRCGIVRHELVPDEATEILRRLRARHRSVLSFATRAASADRAAHEDREEEAAPPERMGVQSGEAPVGPVESRLGFAAQALVP